MTPPLQVSISGQFQQGDEMAIVKFGASSLEGAVTGKNSTGDTLTLGVTDETLPLGDIGTPGFLWVKNNGDFPARFRSGASGNYDVECPPGLQIFTGWNGAAIHGIAIGGNTDIQFKIIEK
jgi:hypothetical protein